MIKLGKATNLMDTVSALFAEPLVRKSWRRAMLRDIHYTNAANRLKLLYLLHDPWNLGSSERELQRFRWTNELIKQEIPTHSSILEIGCGEGHQSVYFSQLCDCLYAIDLSRRAIRRAQRRCPTGHFAVADACSFMRDRQFDLIVACEILYYLKDIDQVLDRFCLLGDTCLVTYFQDHAPRLDPYFAGRATNTAAFHWGGTSWTARWWHNPLPIVID